MSKKDGVGFGAFFGDLLGRQVKETYEHIADVDEAVRQHKQNLEQESRIKAAQQSAIESDRYSGMTQDALIKAKKEIKDLKEKNIQYSELPYSAGMNRTLNARESFEKMENMYFALIAEWVVSQKAHKALAEKYGSVIGKTPEQIQSEMREEIAKVKIEFPKLDGLIKNNQ
ncbi:hypothetical protein [Castellaniella sp.]|uniref:hypothetical protein n=1 Tax=Castellaniella sp. TaxID=1955812 RepID=UPI003A922729